MKRVLCLVGVILFIGCLLIWAADPTPAVIEMDKADSLDLMNKKFAVVAAEADYRQAVSNWNETLKHISGKYSVPFDANGNSSVYDLDLTHGVFKPKTKETK